MTVELINLIPNKFHGSTILQALLDVVGGRVDAWHVLIADLLDNLDPYNVSEDYIQYLADLIGFTLTSSDDASISIRRKELIGAVDWYKTKGTYQSLQSIVLWAGFNVTIYDKYTNSESNYNNGVFSDQLWFVGDENENPSGLDSTYFKTPHFGFNIDLDKIFAAGTYTEGALARHLWRPSLFVGIEDHVERTRPINTVPHFVTLHTCIANESLEASSISETETVTRIVGSWTYSSLFFDGAEFSTAQQRYFDSGDDFDQSFSNFLDTLTVWKLGSSTADSSEGAGDEMDLEGTTPGGGFALGNVILEGTVDSYTMYADRTEIFFTVPKATAQSDINELGIYTAGGALIIASTFLKIHKDSSLALKVKVIIYRTTQESNYSLA